MPLFPLQHNILNLSAHLLLPSRFIFDALHACLHGHLQLLVPNQVILLDCGLVVAAGAGLLL